MLVNLVERGSIPLKANGKPFMVPLPPFAVGSTDVAHAVLVAPVTLVGPARAGAVIRNGVDAKIRNKHSKNFYLYFTIFKPPWTRTCNKICLTSKTCLTSNVQHIPCKGTYRTRTRCKKG